MLSRSSRLVSRAGRVIGDLLQHAGDFWGGPVAACGNQLYMCCLQKPGYGHGSGARNHPKPMPPGRSHATSKSHGLSHGGMRLSVELIQLVTGRTKRTTLIERKSDGLQPTSHGLKPASECLQPTSDNLLAMASNLVATKTLSCPFWKARALGLEPCACTSPNRTGTRHRIGGIRRLRCCGVADLEVWLKKSALYSP